MDAEARRVRERVEGVLAGLAAPLRAALVERLAREPRDAATTLILEAAVGHADPAPDPLGVFFAPLAPFIEHEALPKLAGRIASASLDGIWRFLTRDAAPEGFGALLDAPDARGFAGLRATLYPRLSASIAGAERNAKARQRLVAQLGGERAYLDFQDLLALERWQPELDRLLADLPPALGPVDGSVPEHAVPLVRFLAAHPAAAACAIAGSLPRFARAADLVRLARLVGGTDDARRLRRGPAAALLDGAFHEIERWVYRARTRSRGEGALEPILAPYHDIVRAVTQEIEIEFDPVWRQRLGDLRRAMSDEVTGELDGLLPALRTAVRVSDTERPQLAGARCRLAVLIAAREARESLALNAFLARTITLAEQAVEFSVKDLMARAGRVGGAERAPVIHALDRAIGLAGMLFGADYAGLLQKARENVMRG